MNAPSQVYARIREATLAISKKTPIKPKLGIVLGSGLGRIAEEVEAPIHIPYTQVPGFHGTSIEGHAGQMTLGNLYGVPVAILQGRFHFYEGYPMEDVVFPTRVLCAMGIHTLLQTNAAGGINTRFRPADLMLIEDHLNLMFDNPLRGPNLADMGPRFPDLSEAYSKTCLSILRKAAEITQIPVHQGVYCGLLGPTYETPAEVRMLRTLGADAVGMSTVPETIAANHLGVRVAGISCITNLAAGITSDKLTHQEVIESSKVGVEKMIRLLRASIAELGAGLGGKNE